MNKPKVLLFDVDEADEIRKLDRLYTVGIKGSQALVFSASKRKNGTSLSVWPNHEGYPTVKIWEKTIALHRIVAKAFLGDCPPGKVVNYKDGNKLNNNPNNLEYCTIAENIHHAKYVIKTHVSCDRTRMPTYKDGQTFDLAKYKHDWYLKNQEVCKNRAATRYLKIRETK
jgi:HNH endonuclease